MAINSGDRDRIEGTLEEGKGDLKQAWGDLTGDDRLKAEGEGDELKGKAQQFMGDIKDKIDDAADDVRNAFDDARDDVERKTR